MESSSKISVTHSKCSVQEGVRMMVTPSMFGSGAPASEKAIVNPPPTIHKAVVVSQSDSTTKMFASIANSQLKTLGAVAICSPILSQAKAEEILVTSKPPLASRSNGNCLMRFYFNETGFEIILTKALTAGWNLEPNHQHRVN